MEKYIEIESAIKLCKYHGFTINKVGNWLWFKSSDNRYSLDEEYKILRDIGFRYSENKSNFYCICNKKEPYDRYKSICNAYFRRHK